MDLGARTWLRPGRLQGPGVADHARRPLARLAALLALVLACLPAAQAQLRIAQQPLLAASPPPPNVVMTIDDSGSMSYGYAPDLVGQYKANAAYASFSYNPLYYNPYTQYVVPPNALGNPVSVTSFNKAYYDGFNPNQGYVDLSCAFTPTFFYTPGSATTTQTCPLAAGTVPPTTGNAGPQSGTGVYGPAYYYVYNANAAGCPAPVTAATANALATLDSNVAPPADTCFTLVPVSTSSGPGGTDETLNFAIWYSFYSTRHQSIISAAAQAMQAQGLESARVAWQGLNSCADSFSDTNCSGWDGTLFKDHIGVFAAQHKTDFYSWLAKLPASGFTPTRVAWWRAGQYYTTAGPNSPYDPDPNDPATTAGSAYSGDLQCVNNFNITLTDGLWNKLNEGSQTNFCGSGLCGGLDTQPTTFPDGTNYSYGASTQYGASTGIYGGGDAGLATGSLADIAFYYWATNLRPDLTGFNTPPYYPLAGTANPITQENDATWPYWNPVNDPATWPHMVNFTVGIGLGGFLALPGLVWSGDAHDPTPNSAYMNLLTGASACPAGTPCTWPPVDPNASGNGFVGAVAGNGNVYDLWHAAINSRGNAFSAASSQDIVNDMGAIIARIEAQSHGNSTAAGSTPSLSASTQLFVASYVGTDWHGVVTAFGVDSTGAVLSTPNWQTTAASIPLPAARTVLTANAALPGDGRALSSRPGLVLAYVSNVATGSSGLPTDLLTDLGNTTTARNQVSNYLLGDASNEQRNGGNFRDRGVTALGDIVDSTPVYTWTESFGYQILPEGQVSNGYGVFLGTKSARTPMVYAGANDGMVHGFNANSGNEVFAYMPHGAYSHIASEKFQGSATPTLTGLVSPNYNGVHAFSVDGQVFVGDAYFGDTGNGNPSWRTVLVGTAGAGGPGVYALDVSSPQSMKPADVLWDMDGTASGDPNLGYTIGQPIIARLNDGNWAAVFGNGYVSPRGCAVLYIVYLYNGQVRTIDTSGASAGTTAACTGANADNGLGSPTLLDVDQNGTIDYVFAGDLHGNLWKFDLSAVTPANWSVAYGSPSSPLPLFTAVNNNGVQQSIVAAPNLGPSANNPGAYILYFVTGRMFATGDPSDTTTQSLYAVQDAGVPVTGSRATLVAQTLVYATDGSANEDISTNPAVTVSIPPSNGWYIDFPNKGERALSEPLLVDGVLLVSTVIRTTLACNGDCGGFIYAVSQFTGAGGLGFLIDPANNTAYDGLATQVGCVRGITLITKGSTLEWYAAGNGPSASSSGTATPAPGTGPGNTGVPAGAQGGATSSAIQHGAGGLKVPGRISWHEVIQQ